MRLHPLTRELAADLARGDLSAVRASNLAEAGESLREVGKAYADFYDRTPSAPPWIGYLAEDESSGKIVGSCGYKGDCRDAMVEIAYFSFPPYERRGFGREMARLLTDLALDQPVVQIVRAHTLREENASVRILRRLGFVLFGTVEDPDDGPVWRWDLERR